MNPDEKGSEQKGIAARRTDDKNLSLRDGLTMSLSSLAFWPPAHITAPSGESNRRLPDIRLSKVLTDLVGLLPVHL